MKLQAAAFLDGAALLRRAEDLTGLTDWGDPRFAERVAHAVTYLNTMPLDGAARTMAQDAFNRLLTDRLKFIDDRKIYPLGEEVIDRPMFAIGEPRAGTTLMHSLISCDPGARSLHIWEIMHPSPPPGVVESIGGGADPQVALADEEWRELEVKVWQWLASFPSRESGDSKAPTFDFQAMTPLAWWRILRGCLAMGAPSDNDGRSIAHKMLLQALQYRRERKFWVCKGYHGFSLKEFFATYPDATVVCLHRDPVDIAAASMATMPGIGDIDGVRFIAETRKHVEEVRQSIAAILASPMIFDARVHHIRFPDFIRDPIEALRGYYYFSGRDLTPQAEAAMRAYLARNPPGQQGDRSAQILADAGYDIAELNEEFRPFRERFGVEVENR